MLKGTWVLTEFIFWPFNCKSSGLNGYVVEKRQCVKLPSDTLVQKAKKLVLQNVIENRPLLSNGVTIGYVGQAPVVAGSQRYGQVSLFTIRLPETTGAS